MIRILISKSFLLALQTNLMKRAWLIYVATFIEVVAKVRRIEVQGGLALTAIPESGQAAKMIARRARTGKCIQDDLQQFALQGARHLKQYVVAMISSLYSLVEGSLCLELARFSNAPLRMHRVCVLGPCASGRKNIAGVVSMCSTFASGASETRSYRNHFDFTMWTSMYSRCDILSETQAASRFCWYALGKDHTVQHASQKAWRSSCGWSLRDNRLFTLHYVCTEAWSYAESLRVWHWNCSWHRFGMKTMTRACAWGFGNIAARQAGGTSGSLWTHDTLFMVDSTCNAGRRKRRSATWIRGWWRSLRADRIVFISVLQTCESLCKA